MNFVPQSGIRLLRAFMFGSKATLVFSASVFAADVPVMPTGGQAAIVVDADTRAPHSFLQTYRNQSGEDASGKEINKFDPKFNPVIGLLSGFDKIWTLGDEAWANGGANGNGPTDFRKVKIVNPKIWAENMAYVLAVAGKDRPKSETLAAYLDDRRSQNYSVLDGLGPLADWYRKGSGASTTINHTLDNFKVNDLLAVKEDDTGTGVGTEQSDLKDFVVFLNGMRGPFASTNPAKAFYTSPRPWRMTDKGEVKQSGKEKIGDREFEAYETNVEVVPSLRYVRENRGPQKDGGFPSGHTNAAYLAAIAYAYAVPERFAEMLTRASDLGENRIVAGMHSPLDVMGGRIMATAVAAAYLNDEEAKDIKKKAFDEVQAYFKKELNQGENLYDVAHRDASADKFGDENANKAIYRQRMTYGFSQTLKEPSTDTGVPKGAEVLLETRLPYLSADQRRAVLSSTQINSNYPLIADSQGWGRLDLVAAASGYGSFEGDVHVAMDASEGGFHAADRWTNDISGSGLLEKAGTGVLTLSGNNSYSGGTVLKDGTLVATSGHALGKGDVYVTGGHLRGPDKELLKIDHDFTQTDGTLSLRLKGAKAPALVVGGSVEIRGGTLSVSFADSPRSGEIYHVMVADRLDGRFDEVKAEGVPLKPLYTPNGLRIEVQ
ncbi:phosphatase PAP2 family protein [Agrobacterium sp. S2]|nr:phosphatase PAP2 family protein [Agrobacterium sp. S2]